MPPSNMDFEEYKIRVNARFEEALLKIHDLNVEVQNLKRRVEELERRLPEERRQD